MSQHLPKASLWSLLPSLPSPCMGHLRAGCGGSLPTQNFLCLCDSAPLPVESTICNPQRQDHELSGPRTVLAEVSHLESRGLGPPSSVPTQATPHPPSFALHLTSATSSCRFYKSRFGSVTAIWNVSARNFSLFISLYLFLFFLLLFIFSPISVTSQITCHVPSWPLLQLVISHELLIHQVPPWISFWSQLVQLFTALRDKQIHSLSCAALHSLKVLSTDKATSGFSLQSFSGRNKHLLLICCSLPLCGKEIKGIQRQDQEATV